VSYVLAVIVPNHQQKTVTSNFHGWWPLVKDSEGRTGESISKWINMPLQLLQSALDLSDQIGLPELAEQAV
jgi:hypothetical protein